MSSNDIYHVVLIGFHHKKGCIIEYCHPPLLHGNDQQSCDPASAYLPPEWQALPSLAMPDGAHNFTEDVVYFHLPPLQKNQSSGESFNQTDKTIYCVSYCRQVDASELSTRDENVTRGTVQKSVVVLSKVPAFGLIHTKLQLPLITDAFLKNFSDKSVLVELYDQLTTSLHVSDESHYLFGLECRDLVVHFRRKLLMIFKLLLLERRVIFYTTRASVLVNNILSLLSLYPHMIENGLSHATDLSCREENDEQDSSISNENKDNAQNLKNGFGDSNLVNSDNVIEQQPPMAGQSMSRFSPVHKVAEKLSHFGRPSPKKEDDSENNATDNDKGRLNILEEDDDYVLNLENARLEMTVGTPEKAVKMNDSDQDVGLSGAHSPIVVNNEGHPLNLFTNGHMCLPYISLQQHGLLQTNSNRGYLVGATNVLFVSQRNLSDAVVDISTGAITYHDPQLENLLSLSPADLRFVEHVMTNTLQESENIFNRGAEWKGGDEWLRGLFAEYLNRMLSVAAKATETQNINDFNDSFIKEWRKTKNFQTWYFKFRDSVEDEIQHPFHGQFSISDVRLRLHHKLQDSEQGRKLEDALSNANDTIINTGRYLGNAFGSAKSWFSNKLQARKNSQPEN